VKRHHLVAYLADVYRLLPALSLNGERSNTGSTARSVPRVFYSAKRLVLSDSIAAINLRSSESYTTASGLQPSGSRLGNREV
jgi:hypothetical protein